MRRRFTVPIFLAIFTLWFWSIFVEPYLMLNVKSLDVAVKNFPKGFENIKIAVVGDIHFGRGFLEDWRMKRIVDAINAQSPDIVIFLGDYTNGYFYQTSASSEKIIKNFSAIKASIGKFGIFGNHDINFGKDEIENYLRRAGIVPICNSNAKVSTKYGDFYIAAINDAQTSSYSYRAALNGIASDVPMIFLSHIPDIARELPKQVDLMLSGHTHGGQIRLPFIGHMMPLRTPRSIVAGLNEFNGHKVFTTMGLGVSRFPIRFLCPPEFTILRIHPIE